MKCKKCGSDTWAGVTWIGVETCLCDNCKLQKNVQKSALIDQEAKQAQTIARVKERLGKYGAHPEIWQNDLCVLLEIVDSQAQKIAEQAKEIEILREAAKYDKYASIARIMKRPKDVSAFTHKKAEALQKLHEFDEAAGSGK